MPPFIPTEEQAAILHHEPGRHARILAGPGTGKSATVIEWLAQARPRRAKLLTFTRAATGELVQKLALRDDVVLEKPSTIHSFCISVLLANGDVGDFPRPFRMADDWETDAIVEPSLARRLGMRKRDVENMFKELAANWESLNPAESVAVGPEIRARFLGGWQEHRRILGYSLLAELPFALRSALRDHPDLDGIDYQVLVVDEYQDLNACDLDVLKRIADRGCAIVGAGDDDQSIYSFRKAHPQGIRDFLEDYPNAINYPLSVTRRCARNIVNWANYVIQGDPDRPADRGGLRAAEAAMDGAAALLSFPSQVSEARGIAQLVHHLIVDKRIAPQEILVLLRSDHNRQFSRPIKEELQRRNLAFSDPSEIKEILTSDTNRRALSVLRIRVHRDDSLAWASLLQLTDGIGDTFFDYIYDRARNERVNFGAALLAAYQDDFPNLNRALARRGKELVRTTLRIVEAIGLPDARPERGWGMWISEIFGEGAEIQISVAMKGLLAKIDARIDTVEDLDRYLGQITPVAKDIAVEKSDKVRIMTLASSKGLTVKATIIAGAESGLIPMDDCDPAEERRLLYVGMTRAEEFLFITWARLRRGPTARMGREAVNERRRLCPLLERGPVESEDGAQYLGRVSSV